MNSRPKGIVLPQKATKMLEKKLANAERAFGPLQLEKKSNFEALVVARGIEVNHSPNKRLAI